MVYRFYRYRSCFVPVSIRRTNDRLLRTGTVPAHSGVFLPVLFRCIAKVTSFSRASSTRRMPLTDDQLLARNPNMAMLIAAGVPRAQVLRDLREAMDRAVTPEMRARYVENFFERLKEQNVVCDYHDSDKEAAQKLIANHDWHVGDAILHLKRQQRIKDRETDNKPTEPTPFVLCEGRPNSTIAGSEVEALRAPPAIIPTQPPLVGSKWRAVGRERPTKGNEVVNKALSTALSEKLEFTKADLTKFQAIKDLEANSFIKVGHEYFKQDAFPVWEWFDAEEMKWTPYDEEEAALYEASLFSGSLTFSKMLEMGPTLGSRWKKVGLQKPKMGMEIFNEALTEGLRVKLRCTPAELDAFQVHDLKLDSFIKVGDEYLVQDAPKLAPKLRRCAGTPDDASDFDAGYADRLLGVVQGPNEGRFGGAGAAEALVAANVSKGSAWAQYARGLAYARGVGVAQHSAHAAELYEKAAEQGYAPAQCSLAQMCLRGSVAVPRNPARAAELFAMAAASGFAQAQCDLALLHLKGVGVSRNYTRAAELLNQAAEQGHLQALSHLGMMYHHGHRGVEKDEERAAALLGRGRRSPGSVVT